MNSKLSGQGVRYLIVGGYNVLFTLAAFWLLDKLWRDEIGVQAVYWTSAVLGVINGFVAQRIFVWKSSAAWHAELVKFAIVNVAVALVNSFLLFVSVTLWRFPAFPSQVVITALLVTATFFVNRHWVFRATKQSERADRRNP